MATKLNAGEVGRSDLFYIDPAEIQVEAGLNGRWQPHTAADVTARRKSFEAEGQLSPVVVRKVADNKVQLVLGYCRYAAAVQFNELHKDKPMKLQCVVRQVDDEEAFRRNIVENRERKDTSPVDDAFNQRRLREEYGWTDVKIAGFYGVKSSYVSQLKKLVALPKEILIQVHRKVLSVESALALVDMTKEERQEILDEAKAAGGTSTKNVKKAARKRKQSKGKKLTRTLSEVREYFTSLTGPAESASIKTLANTVLEFIGGSLTEDATTNQLAAIFLVYNEEMPLVITGHELALPPVMRTALAA